MAGELDIMCKDSPKRATCLCGAESSLFSVKELLDAGLTPEEIDSGINELLEIAEAGSRFVNSKNSVTLENVDPEELFKFLESIQLHYPSKYQVAYLDRLVGLARAASEGSLNTESTSSD